MNDIAPFVMLSHLKFNFSNVKSLTASFSNGIQWLRTLKIIHTSNSPDSFCVLEIIKMVRLSSAVLGCKVPCLVFTDTNRSMNCQFVVVSQGQKQLPDGLLNLVRKVSVYLFYKKKLQCFDRVFVLIHEIQYFNGK